MARSLVLGLLYFACLGAWTLAYLI